MNYKELQKLNEIIENLKAHPNSDENIQFVLDLADNSVKKETLKYLIENNSNNKLSENRNDNEENCCKIIENENIKSDTILFTKREVSDMDKTFRKHFIINGYVAHVIKRKSGKNGFYFQIRYRRNGYNIQTSSVNLHEAKRKFLEKTKPENIGNYIVKKGQSGLDSLEEIFEEWYQYKLGTINEKGLKQYESNFYSLPEALRKKSIEKIRTIDIDKIMKELKPRKYEDLRTLFNGIFKYAIASGIITHNPVALIPFKRAERQVRDCLSSDEIQTFLKRLQEEKYERIKQGSYILYFFGLRPCEIEDEPPKREGNFLIARNRKRKGGKIEYKKIPIPKQAQELIDWDKPLTFQVSKKPREEWFKEILNGKTAYNLRHTFATICQQYVRPDIVDIWMGDSPQRLVGRVYTHFPDKFMYEQMQKVEFPILQEENLQPKLQPKG